MVWIVVSDLVVEAIGSESATPNIVKGAAFVISTALLLAVLLRRHETQVRLADQRARDEVRDLVDQSNDLAYVVDLGGRFLLINRALSDLVGIEPGRAAGCSRDDVLDADAAAEHRATDARVLETGAPVVVVERIGEPVGGRKFRSTRFPIRDRAGQIVSLGCIAVDITDEERIQAQVRASEAAYQMMFDSSPLPLWIHDSATLQMLAANDAALRLYGYERDQFLQLRVGDLYASDGDGATGFGWPPDPDSPTGKVTTHRDSHGRLLDIDVETTTAVFEGRSARVVLSRDVTDAMQAVQRDQLLLALPEMYQGTDHELLVEVVERVVELTHSTGGRYNANLPTAGEFVVGEAVDGAGRALHLGFDEGPEGGASLDLWGKAFAYSDADRLLCSMVLRQASRLIEREHFIRDLELAAHRQEATLTGITRAVGSIVEARDPYTAGHQQRVGELAAAIGRRMGLSAEQVDGLRIGGYVHDVGKIAVPTEILTRTGPLDPLEYEMVQRHSRAGSDILAPVPFPWPVVEMVEQHHERLNGSGYPAGLVGDEILLEARIIAVADVYDAITSTRPYRPNRAPGVALETLAAGAGTLYDSDAIAALDAHLAQLGVIEHAAHTA
ncbi:MAG: PAS domain-containing protein [Actinomycetota bacterium]|nr:PAS domain-containing protein [Actinomycetota bacterium]